MGAPRLRPFVTRYVALSPDLERYLHERVGVAANRIEQIYNGVDTTRFRSPPRADADRRLPVPGSDCWLVGTVGRMEPVKDQTQPCSRVRSRAAAAPGGAGADAPRPRRATAR